MTLLLAALSFGSFMLTRIILMVYTGPNALPSSLWPTVIGKGILFDAATLAYLLPLTLSANALTTQGIRKTKFFTHIRITFITLVIFFLLLLSVTEIIFWIEFHTRFNFIALDYLIYTNEVILNIWQSYPILWILFALAIISVMTARVMKKYFLTEPAIEYSTKRKVGMLVAAFIFPIISFWLVRVEMMYHQGNAFEEELSGNGLFTLAAAARHNELDYDRFYATLPQEKANHILRQLGVEWTDDLYRRQYDRWGDDAGHHPLPSFLLHRPRHMVLISIESLSAKFLGVYGSKEGLTPQLDRLASQGLLFSNVFATGTRTVRGLEALSLSTPPIPGQSIIRRPKNARLASIGEMLRRQDFEVFFLYGGYGYFDNMNSFFEANNYTVRDRASINKEFISFENAWGVADEDLFNNTIRVLDETVANKKPIFAHIMTTSNHRPYTYPNGRIDIPSPGGRRGAVKYTDYAIGKFIEQASSKPWFKETLFVITADHCASVAGRTQLPIADYRIPLILYGPHLIKPGQINRMISQIDIPPTLLDILGMAGDDNLFGKEVMEQDGPPRAFISNYQNLGYYKQDQLIVLKPKRKIEAYYVNPHTLESTPIVSDPALVNEAIAYYQTSARAFKLGNLELLWK